jgi:hypothetical protein
VDGLGVFPGRTQRLINLRLVSERARPLDLLFEEVEYIAIDQNRDANPAVLCQVAPGPARNDPRGKHFNFFGSIGAAADLGDTNTAVSARKMRYDEAGNLVNDAWSSFGTTAPNDYTRHYDGENRTAIPIVSPGLPKLNPGLWDRTLSAFLRSREGHDVVLGVYVEGT